MEQTVTLAAEDWDVVRAALGYMVENTSPMHSVHMETGRIYHSVKSQTSGYTSDEAINQLRTNLGGN